MPATITLAAIAVFLLLLTTVGILWHRRWQQRQLKQELLAQVQTAQEQAAYLEDHDRERLLEALETTKAALAAGDYDRAAAYLDDVKELQPE